MSRRYCKVVERRGGCWLLFLNGGRGERRERGVVKVSGGKRGRSCVMGE